jgi:hypothetical protein
VKLSQIQAYRLCNQRAELSNLKEHKIEEAKQWIHILSEVNRAAPQTTTGIASLHLQFPGTTRYHLLQVSGWPPTPVKDTNARESRIDRE